jgi:translation initiation factor IF-1
VRGRVRLADGETVVVFEMLNELLKKAEITFRNQRIDRG